MSDTKALYNVVADALAGQGREAQDALETLMGRLRDAEADNAALFVALRNLNSVYAAKVGLCEYHPARDAACDALNAKHPGAALLEELEGLRTENERLRQERDHWEGRASLTVAEVAQTVSREPIAIRVEGIPEPLRAIIERDARNAALEEAEGSLFHLGFSEDAMGRETLHRAMGRIRALKTGQGA